MIAALTCSSPADHDGLYHLPITEYLRGLGQERARGSGRERREPGSSPWLGLADPDPDRHLPQASPLHPSGSPFSCGLPCSAQELPSQNHAGLTRNLSFEKLFLNVSYLDEGWFTKYMCLSKRIERCSTDGGLCMCNFTKRRKTERKEDSKRERKEEEREGERERRKRTPIQSSNTGGTQVSCFLIHYDQFSWQYPKPWQSMTQLTTLPLPITALSLTTFH